MIISDIVFKKNVYRTDDNNLVAIREDCAGMTVIPLKSSPEYINRVIKRDWKLLAKFETTYGDLQWNIKKVTANFAFGPLNFSIDNNLEIHMETSYTDVNLYNSKVFYPENNIEFNPRLIWEELENNFIEEDTYITCELYDTILKIIFPEYYVIIVSLRDD